MDPFVIETIGIKSFIDHLLYDFRGEEKQKPFVQGGCAPIDPCLRALCLDFFVIGGWQEYKFTSFALTEILTLDCIIQGIIDW